MNLSQNFNFSCDSSYTIASFTYHNGIISMVVDYFDDMEDRNCNVTLGYDSTYLNSQASVLNFTVDSRNTELLYVSRIEEYKTIKFIFEILSYIALGIFVVSLSHKLIGA